MSLPFRRPMPHVSLLSLLLVAPALMAQTAPSSLKDRLGAMVDPGTGAWTAGQIAGMARLRDAALADPYAYNELEHLSDNIGPRLGGSPQAQAAVEWVAAQMRAEGATVTLEKTTIPHWVRGEEAAALTAWPGMAPGTTQKIVLTALGGSGATPASGLTAPVVVVRSFDELKALAPAAVKGKILLFDHPFNDALAESGDGLGAYKQSAMYRALGPFFGSSQGAVAVLVRSAGQGAYRLAHTGGILAPPGLPQVPAAAVTAEDAGLIARLAAQGPVTMHLTLTPQTLPPVESYNVIADWKGAAEPEKVVLVSGHLDSWDLGTGATDDGAGVVMAMDTIHLLHAQGLHPRRTVRFVAWMDEESGQSSGGKSYAKEYGSADMVAAMESDIGSDHPVGLGYSGSAAFAKYLAPVAHVLDPMQAGLVQADEEIGEDVVPLLTQGVPGVTPMQDTRSYFLYHHTAADTFDKVNAHTLAENCAVMAVAAYALADAAEPAPR